MVGLPAQTPAEPDTKTETPHRTARTGHFRRLSALLATETAQTPTNYQKCADKCKLLEYGSDMTFCLTCYRFARIFRVALEAPKSLFPIPVKIIWFLNI